MTPRRLTLLFLFLSCALFARDIQVYVEDEDLFLPLEGATVTLRTGEQFFCGPDGKARVTVPDGQNIITVSYPGYEPLRIVIPPAGDFFSASLRLGGIMTNRELVIEASRPDTDETRSGRSVAISESELTRTAEIGIIEDVMSSVKLLPGVGYSGMFNAMPSIRGGDPDDLMAALDGFYLERPYHWMGGVSIFDPKMVSSARLSHGVFSARYGHTISGLLEVTSRSPSPTETEIEAAIGSSAASLNLSIPINGRGGILFMGKVTYWDTFVLAAQGLSRVVEDETLALINSVSTSPYIRSAAISANYRIGPNAEWRLNGFFGSDGVGADARTDYDDEDVNGTIELKADYNNYQGFLITGMTASPSPSVALRFSGGAGFINVATEDSVDNDVTARYNEEFINLFSNIPDPKKPGHYFAEVLRDRGTYSAPNVNVEVEMENIIFSAQLRADADWDLGHGFIAAFGVQELYSRWKQNEEFDMVMEISVEDIKNSNPDMARLMQLAYLAGLLPIWNMEHAELIYRMGYSGDVINHGITSSAYGLVEYASDNRRFGAELGLRVDHLYFIGKDFSVQTMPAFNPRLNLDFEIARNIGGLDLLSATIGTGLFSSMNSLISFIEKSSGLEDFDVKLNRSWTTVAGIKIDFLRNFTFNIEGYYKYVFDRAYITADITSGNSISPSFNFDGIGRVWGFDLQLQRHESRYIDGWISYTFTWAKYKDPGTGSRDVSLGNSGSPDGWYFPSFHRYHNANIVLNIKPANWFNISVRFGFASGQPRRRAGDRIYAYPVQVVDENMVPVMDNGYPVILQRYRRDSFFDESQRGSWSLPLDVKFSFFPAHRSGKTRLEIYLAAENLLSLVYKPEGNTTFNEYTGREDPGGSSGNFDLPIPMISFGFKWKY
jgi:hypothetical protein